MLQTNNYLTQIVATTLAKAILLPHQWVGPDSKHIQTYVDPRQYKPNQMCILE